VTDADTEYDDYRDNDMGRARPWWVEVGLFGVRTRAAAWVYFWLTVFLVAASAIGALFFPWLALGTLFAFAALWYYLCIRWVDRHGRWGRGG
jgi:hypothetical protein